MLYVECSAQCLIHSDCSECVSASLAHSPIRITGLVQAGLQLVLFVSLSRLGLVRRGQGSPIPSKGSGSSLDWNMVGPQHLARE